VCERRQEAGGRRKRKKKEEGGADTELKTKTPHVNVGKKQKLKPVVARNASHISHGGQ